VDDSAASLPDEQLTYTKRRLLYYLKRGVRSPEQIEVLALARSRANGVLALTNHRLGFAWELGFSPTRRFLDRASIVSAEVEDADLVVRDASQVWRYQNVSPPGRAAEIADRLSQVAPAARPVAQFVPPPRSSKAMRILGGIALAVFALFLLVGVIATIFGIR
jgi:hypothetical protein